MGAVPVPVVVIAVVMIGPICATSSAPLVVMVISTLRATRTAVLFLCRLGR
jgi:hypothetical protein